MTAALHIALFVVVWAVLPSTWLLAALGDDFGRWRGYGMRGRTIATWVGALIAAPIYAALLSL